MTGQTMKLAGLALALWQGLSWASGAGVAQTELDLTRAVVVAPASLSGAENKAVQMLIEEVERRTQVRWQRVDNAPNDGAASISISRANDKAPLPREGYRIQTSGNAITIMGNDARGVLF